MLGKLGRWPVERLGVVGADLLVDELSAVRSRPAWLVRLTCSAVERVFDSLPDRLGRVAVGRCVRGAHRCQTTSSRSALGVSPGGAARRRLRRLACGLVEGRNNSSSRPRERAGERAAAACERDRLAVLLGAPQAAGVPRQPGVHRQVALGEVRGDRRCDRARLAALRVHRCALTMIRSRSDWMPSSVSMHVELAQPGVQLGLSCSEDEEHRVGGDQRFAVKVRRAGVLDRGTQHRRQRAGRGRRARQRACHRARLREVDQRAWVGCAEENRRPALGLVCPALHELALRAVAGLCRSDERRGSSPLLGSAPRRSRGCRRARRPR